MLLQGLDRPPAFLKTKCPFRDEVRAECDPSLFKMDIYKYRILINSEQPTCMRKEETGVFHCRQHLLCAFSLHQYCNDRTECSSEGQITGCSVK